MSSLGKRTYGANLAIAKRARTSASRQMATFRRSAAMSSRYNRSMSARLQRAPGVSRETGFVDLAGAAYNMDTTGSIVLLATVAQGASVNQRVGKKIVLKSLQCRGSVIANGTAIANDVAFLIVYDKRPTGALPAITDILVSANAQSFNNDANSGRFVVLKREDFTLLGNPLNATTITETTMRDATFFLKIKDMPVVYKAAATGAIGDIEQGALYLVTVGNNVAGTTAATANLAFRTRFLDI